MITLALLAVLSVQSSGEWTETRFHRVHLRNGNFVDGHLIDNQPEYVTLKIKTGELEIARDLLYKVEFVTIRSYAEKPADIPAPAPPAAVADPAPPVAAATVTAGPLQRRAEELLVRARHVPAERKDHVLRELVGLGTEGALTLVAILEKLGDEDLRLAGRVLRDVRSPALKEPLKALLQSSSSMVRAEAVATLAALGVESDRLSDPSPAVRVAALEAAATFKSRTAFERAAALCSDPHPELRRQAVRTSFILAREHELGPALADALARVLGGGAGTDARVEILDALGRLRNAAVWSAAAEELKREAPEVRVAAARCLGELRTTEASSAMSDAIANETSTDVKVALAEAAGKLGDAELVPELIARLADADPRVVRASADALSRITRQNHGTNRARWQDYWARVQGR
jgi:HEAT repeat protein